MAELQRQIFGGLVCAGETGVNPNYILLLSLLIEREFRASLLSTREVQIIRSVVASTGGGEPCGGHRDEEEDFANRKAHSPVLNFVS